MALISFPNVDPYSSSFRCSYVVAESISPFTRTSQTYDWGGSAWEGEVVFETFVHDKRDDRAEIQAFIMGLKGSSNVFNYGDAEYLVLGARGVATGTPLVNGALQGGVELLTDGWTANTVGIMKAADYIQLGSGENAELYQLLSDVDSDAAGEATLTLNRALRTTPNDNDVIEVAAPKGTFRLSINDLGWEAEPSGRSRITIPFVEAV